jgi:carbon monoxide dehydrogenase subunit G
MKLHNSFTVPVDPADAWKVLLDIETVAPCMPGASLDQIDGDSFTGTVKVRLGPISMTYQGSAEFVEKDPIAHRAVIRATGRDTRGSGMAKASVTAQLQAAGAGETAVTVDTDLAISGKPAQFGRGVLEDVSSKLVGQFADCLAAKIAAGEVASAAPVVTLPATGPAAGLDAGRAVGPAAGLDAGRAVGRAAGLDAGRGVGPQPGPAAAAPLDHAASANGRTPPPHRSPIRAAPEIDLLEHITVPPHAMIVAAGAGGFLVGVLFMVLLRRLRRR